MREIKFRLWKDGRMQGVHTMFSKVSEGPCEPQNLAFSEDEVIMQFTGLKDKNGKEIYEGDILTDEYESIGIVKWNQDDASFVIDYKENEIMNFDLPNEWAIVKGNIYENPEFV